MNNCAPNWRTAAGHCRAGRCEAAITALEELVRCEPANADLHHQLGICYSGSCRRHRLVSSAMAISYLEKAVSLASPAPTALRADYLDSLGNSYVSGGRPAEAMPYLREAAEIYRRLGLLGEWAREQYNLGNACCDMPLQQMREKWQQAVTHFRQALKVRTRDRDPLRHAATLQNLGTAYRETPSGDRSANVRAAIVCYYGALRIYSRTRSSEKYGDLHNNLGNAYLSLPGSPASIHRNLRRAFAHFDKALRIRKKTTKPCDYGATQFNKGQAYLKSAEFDPADLGRAVDCFQEARECFRLCQDATMAAMAESVLKRIGSRLGDVGQAA